MLVVGWGYSRCWWGYEEIVGVGRWDGEIVGVGGGMGNSRCC